MIHVLKLTKTPILIIGAFLIVASLVIGQLALADTTGTLLPQSDGNYSAWSSSGPAAHYTKVDESTCNGTTDYVKTNNAGDRDAYHIDLSSIPDGRVITDIAITPCASRNKRGAGSSTMNVFYRFNGTDSSDLGNYNLMGVEPVDLPTTIFNGLSLSKDGVSILEIGAVLSAGNKGARLSQIAVVITHAIPVPAAPSNLSAAAVSATQINLAWADNSDNEDGFKVERSDVQATGPWTQVASTTADTVAYSDTGLTASTVYWYRIRAFNGGGSSAYSNVASDMTLPDSPVAPSSLVATNISSSQNNLSWTDNSDNEDGFKVEQSINSSFGPWTHVATTTANVTSYGNTGLAADHTYYYRVRAFNSSGNSSYSNTDFAVTYNSAPATPSNLSATASSTIVRLDWTDNSDNEDGFKVERGTNGVDFMQIATTTLNAVTYTDDPFSQGTYYYRIRAFNVVGNSLYSDTVTTTIP